MLQSLPARYMLPRYAKKYFMVEVTTNIITAQSTRRLWLVRHGLTEWNTQQRFCGHSDIPLSAQGRTQALWLAQQLEGETISAICTSDLVRARETAEIIAHQRTPVLQIEVSAAWREIAFGDWEGLTYEEIVERFKGQTGFFVDPEHYSPPNGESLMDLQQRVKTGLAAIVHGHDSSTEGDVVIVSHGGPLRILLCGILGMSLQRHWQLRIDPGSLSAIDLLPAHELSAPNAILSLLNVQGSTRVEHPGRSPVSTGRNDVR
jgi:alpha-ribazole phosphatase